MIERLALRTLAELMQWSDETSTREFAWLRLMARLKYDGYHDYLAGVRFVESLVTWLRQFAPGHRADAYRLVRERLVFVTAAEMRRLVERLYPRVVEPRLVKAAAAECQIPWYRVWADPQAVRVFERIRRQTLFVGLSDGARMDVFRRANVGTISNEQTVIAPLVDDDKWRDLAEELRKDEKLADVPNAKFTHLYLIDDLTASGTTLLRLVSEKQWKGKLVKLHDAVRRARDTLKDAFPVAGDVKVCVHHFIATRRALTVVEELDARARASIDGWFASVEFDAGLVLDDDARLVGAADEPYRALARDYYDSAIENRHSLESGVKAMQYGYQECALSLVLEHNTPNNSFPLLWAETDGKAGAHPMRPLFRRRSRHV